MSVPEKALCVMALALGDSVCVLPEIRFLAEKHGNPADVLIKRHAQVELYDGLDYVGRVFQMKRWSFPPELFLRMTSILKSERYSHIYFLNGKQHARKFLRILAFTGELPQQINMGFPADARRTTARSKALFPTAFRPPELTTTEQERGKIRQFLAETHGWSGERPVLFHPGSSHAEGRRKSDENSREWPVENWRRAMLGIRELAPDALFIVTGTENERGLADAVLSGVPGKTASLTGALSLRNLLSLQAVAHSCVSTDTGAAHTAMAVGCPTVILYDRCDPRNMGRCSPKGWGAAITIRGFRTDRNEFPAPIRSIRPETVVRLWAKLPPRQAEVPPECFISHYCEGDGEAEVLPALF